MSAPTTAHNPPPLLARVSPRPLFVPRHETKEGLRSLHCAGGTKASEFVEANIWPNFKSALDETHDAGQAFKNSYKQTDVDYIKLGREKQDPSMLLTGTCAVGAYGP